MDVSPEIQLDFDCRLWYLGQYERRLRLCWDLLWNSTRKTFYFLLGWRSRLLNLLSILSLLVYEQQLRCLLWFIFPVGSTFLSLLFVSVSDTFGRTVIFICLHYHLYFLFSSSIPVFFISTSSLCGVKAPPFFIFNVC